MNICLYGASSPAIAKSYIFQTEALGAKLASHGHTLIFGGGANGLMGAAARGVFSGKGKIIGIAPSFFNVDGALFKGCTRLIYTNTMRERKQAMEEMADAFIVTPGGPGTFDEFFEILTLRQLGRHTKPIAIFNIGGYFDNIKSQLENAVHKQFMTEEALKLCYFTDNIDKLLYYIESYQNGSADVESYKYIK